MADDSQRSQDPPADDAQEATSRPARKKNKITLAAEVSRSTSLVVPGLQLPPNLFLLPVHPPVVFPSLLAPLFVSQPRLIAMIEEAINRQRMIGLVLIRDGSTSALDQIQPEDLYLSGVVVKILKRLKMPDGSVNLLVHSIKRFRNRQMISKKPYLVCEAEYLEDVLEKSNEMDALTRSVMSHVKKLSESNPFFTEEMRLAMMNAPGSGSVADLIAFALALPKNDAQDYLETLSVKARFEKLLIHLRREQDVADLQKKINEEVNTKLTKMQREFFLKEQLKTIRRELDQEHKGKEQGRKSLAERIEAAGMTPEVKQVALEELEKFEALSENSPEYNITRNYLETLVSLPWSRESLDQLDLKRAALLLNEAHYGLEKVKDRILEFLAVRKLKADPKGSIICLVGPPGVGKTSLGRSIAKTLQREFFRFSLGGMRDEAEIKGHRRTYVAAMPGKVIQGIKRAGTKNCVLMLDEIDKLGQSYQGDPASALLEVLDPEQNHSFLDHYLDVPFDLSKILFITTANTTDSIPGPLLDRMELIELPGYTLEEKEDITARFIIPQEIAACGLLPKQLIFEKQALRLMMLDYAREPGLRSLQKLINRIARKAARTVVMQQDAHPRKKITPIRIHAKDLQQWLGPKRFYNEVSERIVSPGVAIGLAWTTAGGEILFIEASSFPGSGTLKLTGQMGEVMTESATLAWSYVKKKLSEQDHHQQEKFSASFFKETDLHLHIPAGAVPKDGPSAGITLATALYSLMTGRKVKGRLGMTGELSLIGKVLPVGGIKEKILAAKRAGLQTLILPSLNQKDLSEVPAYAYQGIKLHFVQHVEEVFALTLEPEEEAAKSKQGKKLGKSGLRKTPELRKQRARQT